jgi:alpha,alpha-trehalase
MKTIRSIIIQQQCRRGRLFILLIIFLFNSCQVVDRKNTSSAGLTSSDYLYNPATDLDELFEDVQLAAIFNDSKTFPDCDPVLPPDTIIELYRQKKNDPEFDLRSFIDTFFSCPVVEEAVDKIYTQNDITVHLHSLWNSLTRSDSGYQSKISSRIPLEYPYVVPGGRFREIYYWDSYFTMEGLAASGRIDLVENMIDNFAVLIDEFGFIPNGNRTYFLSRSQPPFFAEMVKLIMREKGDSAGVKYLPSLLKEYEFWMNSNGDNVYRRTVKVGDLIINRYWDDRPEPRPEAYKEDYLLAQDLSPEKQDNLYRNIRAACESGWDFSSRWLRDEQNLQTLQTTNILPVDLNCLMYNLEDIISRLYHVISNNERADYFVDLADKRKCFIQEVFWNQEEGYFFDYNFSDKNLSEVYSLAGVYPLYFNIATKDQAERVADQLHKKFWHDLGLATTTISSGEQWDAPNGWAPLHWITIGGLENYGFGGFATVIAQRWLSLNQEVFLRTGKMVEKYNVSNIDLPGGGGEYPLQDGFGWTNGVYLGLLEKGYSPEK